MSILRRLPLLVLVFLVWVPPAFGWSWPVDGPVLQPYAYDESHPYAAGQHRGIDIGADSVGDPVVAPAGGTVAFAGSVPTSGKCVTIETADGYSVTLTHLGAIGVKKGATVSEGDVVGTVGPSGTPEVDGAYVHLGIRLAADPLGYVDPLGLLPAPAPQARPAPAHDPGSGRAAAPPVAAPAPPAAPTDSTAPAPDEPAAPADPVTASSGPAPAQSDSTAATGDPQTVRRSGRPAPAPHAPTVSSDLAELPGSADRTAGAEEGIGDGADSGGGDEASDSGRATVEVTPRPARSPDRRASGAAEALSPVPGQTRVDAGRSPLRPPASESAATRSQQPAATSLLSLVLGVGPGLLALAAALVTALGRPRRRATHAAVTGAAVVHLPRHPVERRHERRAA